MWGRLWSTTDDEMADVLSQTIDAYLADMEGEDVDTDDLALNLVTALRSADVRRRAAAGRPS
ncbi:hypothetical protein [Streptomyces sp. NPDC127112]|uniref:hypothetical protein n=1 Tax=Streptomyces sp. NPDC127112 TaxID=3345364 RepID=UPI00363FF1F2